MSRIKRGRVRTKKRRALLQQTKGYRWGRKRLVKLAKTATKKAGVYAFRDRRAKKRINRGLWQVRINAATRLQNLSYSKFIHLLKNKNIELDRKVLSELASQHPQIMEKLINMIK